MLLNASRIFEFGQPMPDNSILESEEILIWYGGWSLQDLRDNARIRANGLLLNQQYKYAFGTEVLPSGLYAIRLMKNSYHRIYKSQSSLLRPNELVAHPVLICTAEIACLLENKHSLIQNSIIRSSIKRRSDHFALERCGSYLRVVRVEDDKISKRIGMASARYIVS
jgi:hypothetical protein